MVKPFYSFSIERYADCARVVVSHITDDGERLHRRVVEDYETLSRGASASARKTIARLRRESASLRAGLETAEASLDQLLDDMGETGQSVCMAAKIEAVEALASVREALAKVTAA